MSLVRQMQSVVMAMADDITKRCTVVSKQKSEPHFDKQDAHEESCDETTPTTTVSECSEALADDDLEFESDDPLHGVGAHDHEPAPGQPVVPQLGPGLFPSTYGAEEVDVQGPGVQHDEPVLMPMASRCPQTAHADGHRCSSSAEEAAAPQGPFSARETLFVFDWDDTILPSSWVRGQGLRLDDYSVLSAWQREQLAEVATAAMETLRLAKLQGTVVLLTNAERGWIELSCLKFMPTLLPSIENVKIVSARTTYETPTCKNPLDWKVHAFDAEIARACGPETLVDPLKRKNILSLGDSVHEREALLRSTADLPNCRSKSLKFVERPDISQMLKQHTLVTECFGRIVHQDNNLDLKIDCP